MTIKILTYTILDNRPMNLIPTTTFSADNGKERKLVLHPTSPILTHTLTALSLFPSSEIKDFFHREKNFDQIENISNWELSEIY